MTDSNWTTFVDMSSGGGRKEDFGVCYIEAPEDEAVNVFYSRFGHSPSRVSCTCCGPDYGITEDESLKYSREHREHWEQDGYVVIRASEIEEHERKNEAPRQGYVWVE